MICFLLKELKKLKKNNIFLPKYLLILQVQGGTGDPGEGSGAGK